MKKHHFLCLLSLLFFTTACEYPITENFIEVTPPDKEISANMDLNVLTNGQAILINQPTQLAYSLGLSKKKASKIIFTLGNKTWEETAENGVLNLNEAEFPNGEYVLKARFYAPTGSGSIADQMGAEVYSGEMSWPVIIDYTMKLPAIVTYRINENKLLELSWQVPTLSHLTIDSYTIQAYGTTSYGNQLPANQTHYVDTRQVGNETTYTIYANLKNKTTDNICWMLGEVKVPANLPRLYTTDWDLENIHVTWELPYNCRLKFRINQEAPFTPAAGENTLTMPVTKFGSYTWWDQHTLTMSLSPIDHPEEEVFSQYIYVGSPGYYYERERGSSWYYNPPTQLLYAIGTESLKVYKYPEITPKVSIAQKEINAIACSRTAPLIAVDRPKQIEIRDAETLELKHTISMQREPYKWGRMLLTPENKLIYIQSRSDGATYDITTYELDGSVISTFMLKAYNLKIASDAKYICYSCNFEMKIVELEKYQPGREYTLPIPYELHDRAMFNPVNSSQLIVPNFSTLKIEIRNWSDYTLAKSIPLKEEPWTVIADPVTGNILVDYNKTRLQIFSITDGKVMLDLAHETFLNLVGNYLTSYDGYLLNIEKPSSK